MEVFSRGDTPQAMRFVMAGMGIVVFGAGPMLERLETRERAQEELVRGVIVVALGSKRQPLVTEPVELIETLSSTRV